MSSDLEVFLQQYDDLVLVTLWEENYEASTYMVQLLESIAQLRRVPVLKLLLSEHREWAHQHGVHGTPALIVYYQHQPLFRVVGRLTPEELRQCFQKLQLESLGKSNVNSVGQAEVTSPSGRLKRPDGTRREDGSSPRR
jgi:thioredoxin-like negative regulator of GroEL